MNAMQMPGARPLLKFGTHATALLALVWLGSGAVRCGYLPAGAATFYITVRQGAVVVMGLEGGAARDSPGYWWFEIPRYSLLWLPVLERPGARGSGRLVIPLWMPVAVSGAGTLLVLCWIGVVRRAARRRRGVCVKCGYDLRGLAAGAKCPECGREDSAAPAGAGV